MVWGLEKGLIPCLGKLRNWEPKKKKSHKNDRLDLMTFKQIGRKLCTLGPEPTKNEQINSNKDINCCYSCLFRHFTASQCLCCELCISTL